MRSRVWSILLLSVLSLTGLTGCKWLPEVGNVKLSDSAISITVGTQRTITARVEPDVADYDGIVWTSSNPKVASVVDGTITGVRDGVTQITATAAGVTSSPCSVTVKSIRVSSVSISKTSTELTAGQAIKLEASIIPSDATNQTLFWATSDSYVATVTSAGLVVAKNPGIATITVRSDDGDHTATCQVTVKAKFVPVSGVTISSSTLSLKPGETSKLTATVSPSNATNQDVTWSSSNASVATVASDGNVTAIVTGTTTITVTTADQGKTATCLVTVSAIPTSSITLSNTTLSLTEGDSSQLAATVSPSNATNKDIIWTSSNPSVATVTSDGTVSANAAGSATITCITSDGGKTATCSVTVKKALVKVSGVTLDYKERTIDIGNAGTLVATVLPKDATNKNVTWTVSDESVLKVTQDGVVTPKKEGTATVTVTTEDGGFTATCEVTATTKVIAVSSVKLDKSSQTIYVGDETQLKATVSPANATNTDLTWISSKTSIATVDAAGNVRGIAAGSATITAKTANGKTATCTVTVINATVAVTGVSVSPTSLSLTEGEIYRLTPTVSPSNATNTAVSWTSSNTSVATVASDGTVTAKAAGTTTITCTTQDGVKKATCSVSVKTATISVTGVSLDKTSLSLEEGKIATIKATVSPSNATNKAVTWSSSDPSVATVSSSGVIAAKSQGETIITCVSNDGIIKVSSYVFVYSSFNKNSPLTFEILESGTIILSQEKRAEGMEFIDDMPDCPDCSVYYQINNSTRKIMSPNNKISVTKGDVVRFWGNNPSYSNYETRNNHYACSHLSFGGSAQFNVSGNIMSLVDENRYSSMSTIVSKAAFAYLFAGSQVISAKRLFLPIDILTEACYMGMFDNCHDLVDMPSLPASKMAVRCYFRMFEACEKLNSATVLPSSVLAYECYGLMFASCSSLTIAPILPAINLVSRCYQQMFAGCNSLRYLKALFTTLPGPSYTRMWMEGVGSNGVFVKNKDALWDIYGEDGILESWSIYYE